MLWNRLKSIFTLLLLLYFLGFAVSPVSAIFPSEPLDHTDVLKKQRTQGDLFFFDIALWEVLKKAKYSDNFACVLSSQKNDETAKTIGPIIITFAADNSRCLLVYSEFTRFRTSNLLSQGITPRLTHSGLSPPLFS